MTYTVNQLAQLAGVSVRTLHHYDAVGVLKPSRLKKNGYREYGEAELLRLQQILFFRELEFPLDEVKRILDAPGFDMRAALRDQRRLLELKKKRLAGLMTTIDKTIQKLQKEKPMEDKDLYGSFTKDEMDAYAEEAKQRWGHTDAYKQSQERMQKMTKEDIQKLTRDADVFMKHLAGKMAEGPASPVMQELIAQHYASLRTWYEPNLAMYRGLANMYVDDPRFSACYEKYATGLAAFMREAMLHYADAQESK